MFVRMSLFCCRCLFVCLFVSMYHCIFDRVFYMLSYPPTLSLAYWGLRILYRLYEGSLPCTSLPSMATEEGAKAFRP